MICDLKIKLEKDPATGEQHVNPETFKLLIAFGEHKNICDDCGQGGLCRTGEELVKEILARPDVEAENVRPEGT